MRRLAAFIAVATIAPRALRGDRFGAKDHLESQRVWSAARGHGRHRDRARRAAEAVATAISNSRSPMARRSARRSRRRKSIKSGGYEGGMMCAGYYPEKFPLLSVMELPFISPSDPTDQCQGLRCGHPPSADRQGDGRPLGHPLSRADRAAALRVHGQQEDRLGRRHEGRQDAHLRAQRQGAAEIRRGADHGDGAGRLHRARARHDRQLRLPVLLHVRRLQALRGLQIRDRWHGDGRLYVLPGRQHQGLGQAAEGSAGQVAGS